MVTIRCSVRTRLTSGSRQSGYSLIEVLIAMAILSTVLLSVLTLFFFGRANVYSGKQMTQAVAIGTSAMEDISSMTRPSFFSAFGISGTTTMGTVDVDSAHALPNDTYSNAILRSTKNITSATDPNGYLARWKGLIEDQNKLQNGYVTLIVMPRQPAVSGGTVTQNANINGSVVKVRIIVRWVEALRPRQVIFDSVKLDRNL